jgi:hypothetical protein
MRKRVEFLNERVSALEDEQKRQHTLMTLLFSLSAFMSAVALIRNFIRR